MNEKKVYNKYNYQKYGDRHIAIIEGNIVAIGSTVKELIHKLDGVNIKDKSGIIRYINDNVAIGKRKNE